jgi:hypothetical protein
MLSESICVDPFRAASCLAISTTTISRLMPAQTHTHNTHIIGCHVAKAESYAWRELRVAQSSAQAMRSDQMAVCQ